MNRAWGQSSGARVAIRRAYPARTSSPDPVGSFTTTAAGDRHDPNRTWNGRDVSIVRRTLGGYDESASGQACAPSRWTVYASQVRSGSPSSTRIA